MPKKWVIAANGGVLNEPPWGSPLKIETGAENIMPTPLAGGQEKSIFNVLSQGGSFDYPPLAAITHFLGILDSVSNFQCPTPRGLIRLPT